jgi:Bacterial proteasome activator
MTDEKPTQDPVTPEVDPVTPEVVEESASEEDGTFVTEPSKLIRIASMTRAMLDEVRASELDASGRHRINAIYKSSIDELRDVLSDDLKDELDAIFLPLEADTPTESELRVAQAQLVGWLEGLFHGIQASLFTQQMSAQAQLEQMRRRRALEAPQQGDEDPHAGLYL